MSVGPCTTENFKPDSSTPALSRYVRRKHHHVDIMRLRYADINLVEENCALVRPGLCWGLINQLIFSLFYNIVPNIDNCYFLANSKRRRYKCANELTVELIIALKKSISISVFMKVTYFYCTLISFRKLIVLTYPIHMWCPNVQVSLG